MRKILLLAAFLTISGSAFAAGNAEILRLPQPMAGMKMDAPPAPPANTVGGPFQLTDQNGRAVTERDYAQFYKLVYFGFTHCPDQCPLTLRVLNQAANGLGAERSLVKILFITTDPARDTPASLKSYLSSFPGIIGLTGAAAQITAVEKEYKVYAEKHTDTGQSDYVTDHSSAVYFMSPDDKTLAFFGPDDAADTISKTMKQYMTIPKVKR